MNVLVIGATGKTGRPVVDALVARGAKVRAGSRTPGSATSPGVEPVRFDWAERGTWRPALEGAEGLYVVGPVGQPEPELLMHQLLADADAIRRVVLLSVLGADRLPPLVPMASWEHDVRMSGREWTVLRPNWFQQNFGAGFAGPLRERGVLELPAGDAAVSFVDTRDVGEAAAVALTSGGHGGQVYDLTGPEALTHEEALGVLGAAAGRELRYVPLDPDDFAAGLRGRGLPERVVEWQVALFRYMRGGGNAVVTSAVPDLVGRGARGLSAYAESLRGALPL
ncbi:NAD(P)H-binding protein [Streptomyces sp. NBC_01477]|uniref:NAD(P)H-binding protein n=1 Tax=Streptomyces sp. NBC_01477 TaxID=2976015 RepID=UPI002E33D1F6|nr:NAD(P)H-binding protein [Streptomyces sp. NBC_01477]